MNERLFAHIHLDTEIRTSRLEGGDATESAHFLLIALQDFEQIYKDEEYKSELHSLKSSLEELEITQLSSGKKQFEALEAHYTKSKEPEKKGDKKPTPEETMQSTLKYFYENISFPNIEKQILNLKEGESVSLNGGYFGVLGKPGHAVLYRFKKVNGEIIIDVFNTGDGVDRHSDAKSQPKGWYQTQASYKLVKREDLGKLLQDLAIPRILPKLPKANDNEQLKGKFNFGMNHAYSALKTACSKISKNDDHLISKSWVGQESGTCSFRVFTPLLHDVLPEKELRDQFKVHYKFRSIQIFYEKIKKTENLQDWDLLCSAIAKLIRIIENKINPEEKYKYKNILNELRTIKADVNQKIKEFKKPILPLKSVFKIQKSPISRSINKLPQRIEKINKPSIISKDNTEEDLSQKTIEKWIKSNTFESKINVEIFYEKINEIIKMNKYGNFEKRCAIEKIIALIHKNNIQIDTSNINNRQYLVKFLNETEKLTEKFKELSIIQSNGHNIPNNYDTIQVVFTLTAITQEAIVHGLQLSCFPNDDSKQLYETSISSFGFMQSGSTAIDLTKDAYDKKHPSMSNAEIEGFCSAMEDELLNNAYFNNIYEVISTKNSKISKRELLSNILRLDKNELIKKYIYDPGVDINVQDLDNFIVYLINESLFGICVKKNHITQKLKYLDHDYEIIDHPLKDCYSESTGFNPNFIFKCEREKIIFPSRSINPWDGFNRSQIATANDADNKKVFSTLFEICGESGVNEIELLTKFIDNNGQEAENLIQAIAFTTPKLAIFNILDYFSRYPDKLTDKYSQVIFMMALFGRGGENISLFREDNYFEHLRSIIDYNLTFFIKEQNAAHGVFLLDFLSKFNESNLGYSYFENKYDKIYTNVLGLCENHGEYKKIALCTKIIQDVNHFNKKINSEDKDVNANDIIYSFCDIILLNKKQQELSDNRNYRIFENAGVKYFDVISNYYHLLNENEEIAKKYFAKNLYPEKSENEINEIAQSISFNTFPEISMTVNEEPMLFNVAKGELTYITQEILLSAIPNNFSTNTNDSKYNHDLFIKTIQTIGGPSFSCKLTREAHCDLIKTTLGEVTFHLQKFISGDSFVYMEKGSEIFQKMDFSLIEYPELTTLFLDNPACSIWRNNSGHFIVLDENLNESFRGEKLKNGLKYKDILIYRTDKNDQHSKQKLILRENYFEEKIDNILEHVAYFTGLGFEFRVYKAESDLKFTIDIPDYQISFTQNDEGQFIYSGNSHFELQQNERMNLPGSMTLYDRINHKQLVLIPNLPFVETGENDGYFKQYLPDYSLSSYKELKENNEEKFKQFAKQKTFFEFELDKHGDLIPKNADEKLFLCYYYMNIKDYDKSFALIKNFSQKEIAEARFPIMELLYRIIFESPKGGTYETTPFNQRILATKIQALLLIAERLKVGKKIQWPEEPHDFICFSALEEVKSFFDDFPNTICEQLIDTYIRHISQGEFPEILRVNDEELSILSSFARSKGHENNKKMYEWHSSSPTERKSSSLEIQTMAHQLTVNLGDALRHCEQFSSNDIFIKKSVILPDEKHAFDSNPKIASAEKTILQEREEKSELIKQAKSLFEDNQKFISIANSVQENIKELIDLSDSKDKLIQFCREIQNTNPSILLAIESSDKEYLSFEDLVIAYLKNDYNQIAENLGVDINDNIIKEIMLITENLMQTDIKLHRLLEIEKHIKKYQNEPSDNNAFLLMTALTQQSSEYTLTDKNRELLIFEYYEKKRLRKNQIESIEHVLSEGNENSCVQFIMGGGKTSVFLPLAAMKNANGIDLSVVIVPEALLPVNEEQLDSKTMSLFSSKSQTLHFDRDSPITSENLLAMLKTLEKTIKQKGYLVTSKETLQALELKYIELLAAEKNNATNAQSIDILENILLTFRQNGKSIIDEVDSVLDIKQEFNYSSGDVFPIDNTFVKDTIYLYKMIEMLPKQKISNGSVHSLMEKLLSKMLEDPKSFVSKLVKKFPQDNITGYLFGENVSTEFIEHLTPNEKDRIALLKHQLTNLLPSTLLQELNVTYGCSKLRLGNFVAIPYHCNNVPAETSRFSSPYETLNLTIQLNLAASIDPALFEKMLHDFRVRDLNENLSIVPELSASKEFSQLTGMSLDFVYNEFNKTRDLTNILSRIEQNPETALIVKCYLIEHNIAPDITHYSEIIKSDSIAVIDQLHSSVGVSGTVQNHHTFHSRMRLAESLNSDTDGKTLFYLKEKQCESKVYSDDKIYPGRSMRLALEQMLINPKTRAIMDIGALFTGMTNQNIAECLVEIIREKQWDIQYILFFDDNNQPCALAIQDGSITPLKDTNEEYLKTILNCEQRQRLTFYDQAHTTGSDITQMPNAHAIATIGIKTCQRDLVQGVMRMRQFSENQTVEFLVSKEVAEDRPMNIENIIQFAIDNEEKELLEDHYRAACKKMTAYTRNYYMTILLNEIKNIPDSPKRQQAREMASQIFSDRLMIKIPGPYKQYGQILTLENTQSVLNRRMEIELDICQKGIKALNDFLLREDISLKISDDLLPLKNNMQKLIDDSKPPICKPLVTSPVSSISEQVKIQTQQQTQQQIQQQTEEVQEFSDGHPFAKRDDDLTIYIPIQHFDTMFHDRIFVTNNYGYIYSDNEPDIERHYQDAHVYCLFEMDADGILNCVLLSQGEVERVWMERCNDHTSGSIWLEMPSGKMPIKGQKPEGIESNVVYQRMLEQVLFFHGDLELLLKHPSPVWSGSLTHDKAFDWMKKILSNPFFKEEKRKFYESHFDEFINFIERSKISFIEQQNKQSIHGEDTILQMSKFDLVNNIIKEIKNISNHDNHDTAFISHFLMSNKVIKMIQNHGATQILAALEEEKIGYQEKTSSPYMALLNIAVIYQDHAFAKKLIEEHKLNIMDFDNDSPNLLAKAIMNKDQNMIHILITNGADCGRYAGTDKYGKYSESVKQALDNSDEKLQIYFNDCIYYYMFNKLSIEDIIEKMMRDNGIFSLESYNEIIASIHKNSILKEDFNRIPGDISKAILSTTDKKWDEFDAKMKQARYDLDNHSIIKMNVFNEIEYEKSFIDPLVAVPKDLLPDWAHQKIHTLCDAIINIKKLGEDKFKFILELLSLSNSDYGYDFIVQQLDTQRDFLNFSGKEERDSIAESIKILMFSADTLFKVFEYLKNTEHHLNAEELNTFNMLTEEINSEFSIDPCDLMEICSLIQKLINIIDNSHKISSNLSDIKSENANSDLDPTILKCAQIVIPDVATEFFRFLEERYTKSENLLHEQKLADDDHLKKGFYDQRAQLDIQLDILKNGKISLEDFKKCIQTISDIMFNSIGSSFNPLENCLKNSDDANKIISDRINSERASVATRQNLLQKQFIELFTQNLSPNELVKNVRQNFSEFCKMSDTASSDQLKLTLKELDQTPELSQPSKKNSGTPYKLPYRNK